MSSNRELGERLVAAAKPRFEDFRVDFERIGSGAGRSMDAGDVTPEERLAMFHDANSDIRLSLQRRYADAGAFEPVAQ